MTMTAKGLWGIEEYNLFCVFDKGLGLREGTIVQVNGMEVGRVSKLELTPESKVKLTFTIKKDYQPWITSDARVYATRDQNLITERIINIEQPSDIPLNPQKVLQNNGTLYAGMAQDIETVVEKAIILLDKVDHIAMTTDRILSMALDTNSSLGAVIGSRSLYNQITHQLENVEKLNDHAEQILATVDQRLPSVFDETDSLFKGVIKTSDKLDTIGTYALQMMGSVDTTIFALNMVLADFQILTRGVRQILNESTNKLERADDLMKGLSDIWFIRNRIPKKDTIPLLGGERW